MAIIRHIEGFTKDIAVPKSCEGWEIYNAPRPFPATVSWQADFIHGIFYGAINPDDEFANENRERARQLDASKIVFVSRNEVEEWGRAYCKQYDVAYEDFGFGDIARSYLQRGNHD